MEIKTKDKKELNTLIGYYTNGFDMKLIESITTSMNSDRDLSKDFDYTINIEGGVSIKVEYDASYKTCTTTIRNNSESLVIKKEQSFEYYQRPMEGNIYHMYVHFLDPEYRITLTSEKALEFIKNKYYLFDNIFLCDTNIS